MYYAGRALAAHRERRLIQLPGGRSVPRRSRTPPYRGPAIPLARQPMPYHGQATTIHLPPLHPAAQPVFQRPAYAVYPPYGFQYLPTTVPPPAYPSQGQAGIPTVPVTHGVPTPEQQDIRNNDPRGEQWHRRPWSLSFRQRVARLLGITPGRASTITSSLSSDSTQLGFRNSSDLERQGSSRRSDASDAHQAQDPEADAQQQQSKVMNESHTKDHGRVARDSSSSRTDAATVHSDDFDRPMPRHRVQPPREIETRIPRKRVSDEQPLPSESSLPSVSSRSDRAHSLPTQSSLTGPQPRVSHDRSANPWGFEPESVTR